LLASETFCNCCVVPGNVQPPPQMAAEPVTPTTAYNYAATSDIFNDGQFVGIPSFTPTHTLHVRFADAAGTPVPCSWGSEISIPNATNPPAGIWWEGPRDENDVWSLIELDLDAPSMHKGRWLSPILHYAVLNITTLPGPETPWNEIVEKSVQTHRYGKPGPPPGTGLHRYIFILCKQEKLFEKAEIDNFRKFGRMKLKWAALLNDYKLTPVGIDFFKSKNPNQSCTIL